MFAFGGFLRHFRGGVPGAPSVAGVPVDRRAELERELAPVFAALDDAQRDAGRIVADARDAAAAARARAEAGAAGIVAQARAGQSAEQQTAAATRMAATRTACAAIAAAADADAERIRRAAAAQTPALIDAIVAQLLAEPG